MVGQIRYKTSRPLLSRMGHPHYTTRVGSGRSKLWQSNRVMARILTHELTVSDHLYPGLSR